MRINSHLFLVHEEMIPNITPAIDPNFRPSKVYLLCSPISIDQTERLELILKQAGINVSRWPLDDPWDVEHVRERVLEFIVNHDHEEIALNVTGGTKPMSLAAYETFKDTGKPIYYVQTERDYVVWLNPRDRESFDLADRIKLPAYFAAYGMRLTDSIKDPVPENLRNLTATLIENVERFADPLTILNGLASKSVNNLLSPPLDNGHIKFRALQDLLDLFMAHDLFSKDSLNRLRFSSEETRYYVNGGWLEEHVYSILFRMKQAIKSIQDLASNVNIEWDIKGSPVSNEIDVACLADNHLYIIECKTQHFDKTENESEAANEVLYKLNTLRNYLGGMEARAMVISYRNFTEAACRRADEFDIKVCNQYQLCNLENIFRNWIKKKP